ncbi:MAG: hypothetical protein R2719_10495 [Micropruina sp.]
MRARAWLASAVAVMLTACAAPPPPGEPMLRSTAPPWPAPRDGLAQIQAAGVESSRLDDTTNQRRFVLTVVLDGEPVPLVPYIGIDRPQAAGPGAHRRLGRGLAGGTRGGHRHPLHQFFAPGRPVRPGCLQGATCGTVTVAADGQAVATPAQLVLATVQERLEVRVSAR